MRASLALDLDGDNKVSAMREGLIVLRVMLGLSGEAALSGSGVSLSVWPRIVTRLKENCGVTVQ